MPTTRELRDRIIEGVLAREGGYVDDPDGSGGETNHGITVAVARAFGYTGSMRSMPRDVARRIYVERYWQALAGDTLEALSATLAEEVVDAGVNCGVARAGAWLQRALNVLNRGGTLYADLVVDGAVGRMTAGALREYATSGRDPAALVRAVDSLQGEFYVELAERREKDERFVYGWLLQRTRP